MRVRRIHSDRDSPVLDAASDRLSAPTFVDVDLFSEDLDAKVGEGRFSDILEDEANDAYRSSSSKLGSDSINPWSMREDRYCEDL